MKIFANFCALFAAKGIAVEIVEPAPADNVVVLKSILDPRIQAIRKIAALRLARVPVPIELFDCLSDARLDWLRALDIQMLLTVSQSSQHRIREHLAGRRAIRGVLAADPDSVAAYRQAMTLKLMVVDHIEKRGSGGGPKFDGKP